MAQTAKEERARLKAIQGHFRRNVLEAAQKAAKEVISKTPEQLAQEAKQKAAQGRAAQEEMFFPKTMQAPKAF
jgi:hypothetical protein